MSVISPPTGAVLAVMALLAVASPAPRSGQQDAPDPETERLTTFAKAHMAINDARDEFHGQIGRIHDEQGRRRARMELEEKIARTLEGRRNQFRGQLCIDRCPIKEMPGATTRRARPMMIKTVCWQLGSR